MHHIPLAFQCIYVYSDQRGENGDGKEESVFQEDGREWRLLGPLYADDLELCDESEEDSRAMVGCFVEACRKRFLKDNTGKSKVMVLGGEERLEYEFCVDRIRLEHVSEFKYLGSVLD